MSERNVNTAVAFWDQLHRLPRFRPAYPNDHIVRFLFNHYRDMDRSQLSALDIGAGAGRHTGLLCELGFQTTATDISLDGLSFARSRLTEKKLTAQYLACRMDALGLMSESFDVAISFGVYYYGTQAEMRGAIAELLRVLKPEGRALIVTRTTADYRFGKGKEIGRNTFILDIEETSERGTTQHFCDEREVRENCKSFKTIHLEKTETTFSGLSRVNSDWIIDLKK